jgi:glyoxylase-like metal-dependent hydrolase (beta-lactamase superfamily II)
VLHILALAVAIPASAQNRLDSGKNALTADLVKTGLYVIYGGGSNSLLRLSGAGLVVVDGKLSGNYEAFLSQVKRISDQPIRVLINTDHHAEHTGNNAAFLGAGADILAHVNVKTNLVSYHAGGRIALPTRTYDREFLLRMGGVDVHLMHLGNAHTSADSVVYFPNLKVVAVGSLFASTPDPDFSAGGSLVGWGPVLAEILKLDFDVVVPSTGPMVGRAELETFKNKIDTLVSRATRLVKDGVPRSKLMASLKTGDLGWRLDFNQTQIGGFFAELSRVK